MVNLFSPKKHNAIAVTELLLKKLNVKVSSGTIQQTLEDHPDFSSILAIYDSLIEWNIDSGTFHIKKDNFDRGELLFPFIAHLNINGGVYILIKEFRNGQYIYSDETHQNAIITEVDFLAKWSGNVLYAIANQNSGERDFQLNQIKDTYNAIKTPLLIITLLILMFVSIHINNLNVGYSALLILKLIGLGTSILLLMHSINANNLLIQNLCSLGKKNNCNAILKSDAAKVTNWLTWSEVGFFYFAGSFLAAIFAPPYLFLLAWLNILALPYTVYSIAYQYKNKNWCVLCCAVQVILVLEFIIFTLGSFGFTLWSLPADMQVLNFGVPFFYLILAFLVPILTWSIIKPILLKATLAEPLKQQLQKFKYNSDLFRQALQSQVKYSITEEIMPIVLGNPNAETVITMVSNPFCAPCAKAHQVIDEWLSSRDDLQVKIIFSTADHDNDEKTKVARHISALGLLKDTSLVKNALNDWYLQNSKKYEQWAAKYPVENLDKMNEVTQRQKAWCKITEITFTPTIFVNGYKLPDPYQLQDLKYLMI
ncbi:MAG: thioredoxin domain-containing protein [Bacteroidota bacterium]